MDKYSSVIIHQNANGFTLHKWEIGVGICEKDKFVFRTLEELFMFMRDHFMLPENERKWTKVGEETTN